MFVMHGLGIFIKLNSLVSHMFYARSFINNIELPISIDQNKYYLSLDTYIPVFAWGDGNNIKNIIY